MTDGESPLETLTLALWAQNLAQPLNGLAAWAAKLDGKLAEAAAAGAQLLLLPEYNVEQWISFAPAGLKAEQEIAWMASQAEEALSLVAALPAKHGVALLLGSMPWPREAPAPGEPVATNRAWLLLPDGRRSKHDKLVLTPGERNPLAWNLQTGAELEIVAWRGLRLATLICLDVEMPALASRLAPHNLDLLLVPSMTEKLSGYSRVFGCAKARAVELMSVVAAVGCIGRAGGIATRGANVSGAAVFAPCEERLGHVGLLGEEKPRGETEGDGPLLVVRDIPIAEIRRLRDGQAEVWPGAWTADHVTVKQAG